MLQARILRTAGVVTLLTLIALLLNGCLECKESILGRYDADKDQFVFLNLYQRIGGQTAADFDNLEKLWNNRDHLITPPIPNILGKTSFLRLSDKQFAQLNLGSPSGLEPASSPLPLDQVKILPGQFFMRGSDSLCYYDQIVVPGTFADGVLKLVNQELKESIEQQITAEQERRVKGGKLVPWAALRDAMETQTGTVHASAEVNPAPAKTDAKPEEPSMSLQCVLSEASFVKLKKGLDDGSIAVARNKSVFHATVEFDDNDAKEAMLTITTILTSLANAIKKPGHDPDLDKGASLLAAIETSSPRPGAIEISVDATKLFPRLESIFDPKSALPEAQGDEAKHAADALAAVKAKHLPIDTTTTVDGILTDFNAGKLQGHPSEKPVLPGEGLLERK